MIRLFRKIRQDLLSEDKYAIYLLYAGGEIILVIIGILVALQLDNWNDNRIEQARGEALAEQLYQELVQARDLGIESGENMGVQIGYIELILGEREHVNIDSLYSVSQDYWAVRQFSLNMYLLYFTELYRPNYNIYTKAVNDGTISLVPDRTFSYALEEIYSGGLALLDNFLGRELSSSEKLEEYIARQYAPLFGKQARYRDGKWDEQTAKVLLRELSLDGHVRYKLQIRLDILKSKRGYLLGTMLPTMNNAIKNYESKSKGNDTRDT